jgi:phospholipid/cholesterol/gamma-HCH transport system ATP-binding protein
MGLIQRLMGKRDDVAAPTQPVHADGQEPNGSDSSVEGGSTDAPPTDDAGSAAPAGENLAPPEAGDLAGRADDGSGGSGDSAGAEAPAAAADAPPAASDDGAAPAEAEDESKDEAKDEANEGATGEGATADGAADTDGPAEQATPAVAAVAVEHPPPATATGNGAPKVTVVDEPPPLRVPEGDEDLPSGAMPRGRSSEGEATGLAGVVTGGGMSDEDYRKAMDYEAAIEVINLTKSFGSFTVLNDVSFRIPKNKITVILGPSGTGKSVFFSHVIGILKPDAGKLLVDGENVPELSEKDLQRIRKKFGILFQDGALFGSLNIFDNVAFPLRQHTSMSEKEIAERVRYRLGEVGLAGAEKKYPNELSGGMRKRAGYARALIMEPEIVMYDEPTSGLDPVRAAFIDEMILETSRKQGGTHVVISHDIPATMRIADYIGLLFKAKMVVFGPKEWIKVHDDVRLRQFVEGRTEGPLGMD